MIKANLIDLGTYFPVGGLYVELPIMPGAREAIFVDRKEFQVERIVHKVESDPFGYRSLIYVKEVND